MKLFDMKKPKPKKDKKGGLVEPVYDEDKYPWGLRLNFNSDEVRKIPALKGLSVGDEVTLQAKAKVIEVSARDTQKSSENRVELQLVKVGVAADVNMEKEFAKGAGE
jgi:hypothetical protein